MAYKYQSRDGLMKTNDPAGLQIWESSADRQRAQQAQASADLMAQDVKLEHPDDGWVDRDKNCISPCYPQFDFKPKDGDLIALGWPWSGYRLVRVTGVTKRQGIMVRTEIVTYWFVDTGVRIDGLDRPAQPPTRWKFWKR